MNECGEEIDGPLGVGYGETGAHGQSVRRLVSGVVGGVSIGVVFVDGFWSGRRW